jgi:hypothetical protein
VNERQEDVDILTEQLDNLHVEPWEIGGIIHKPNEKCKISTLSDKKHGTSESENFCLKENSSVCEKVDEIDRNNESFDDTNEFEITCAEDNMSLRSRLLRKISTNCRKTSNLCNMVEAEFVDSESENESDTYFQLHSEIIFEKPNKNQNISLQSPARTLEHKLQNENFYTPNTNIKNKDKEFLNLNEQTPDQDTKTDDIQTLPDFEETSVKIYSVSDFSHTGNVNDEVNTPNVSQMRNLSPSLYQTFLESTPTTTSKLHKASLLNSMLQSSLQVDAILNVMRKRHEVVSPVVAAVYEAKSLDRSVNNLSSVSMNGTIPAFGNFQIESSLLKSIISSGGSITTSPDVRNCLNIPNQNRKSVDVEMSAEDKIVSKLSFDVKSPPIPLQKKCTSHLKTVKPCGKNSKSSTSSIILKKEDCPVIDLTCDTPKRHDCRTTLDLSCHDDSSINKVRNKPDSNFCVDTGMTYRTPDHKTLLDLSCHGKSSGTKFSDKSTLDLSVDINFNIGQTSIDTTSPFIDRNSPSIQGLGSPTWNKGKENETIVSASQDMIYTNKISVVDVTFDENSPVSLADRLRRKLNISTMRGVLQEVTGNKKLQK